MNAAAIKMFYAQRLVLYTATTLHIRLIMRQDGTALMTAKVLAGGKLTQKRFAMTNLTMIVTAKLILMMKIALKQA